MEIKAKLDKPYTKAQRQEFIVEQNHNKGFEIKETETALEAWGKTEEEMKPTIQQQIQVLENSITARNIREAILDPDGWAAFHIKGIDEQITELRKQLEPKETE
jgi:DNA-binding transcriptional MerR regulator